MSGNAPPNLLDGDGYRQSLRDGRRVFYRGELIDDVTTHPATSGGIENVNGFPVPYLRIRVYNEFDRTEAVAAITDYLGLGAGGEP